MILSSEQVLVKDVLKEIYSKHNSYNAYAFNEFLSCVSSAKNLLARYAKGTSASGDSLINAVVAIANYVGVDCSIVFETPNLAEPHHSVIRAILHHLGLPYTPGPLHPQMSLHLQAINYRARFSHV